MIETIPMIKYILTFIQGSCIWQLHHSQYCLQKLSHSKYIQVDFQKSRSVCPTTGPRSAYGRHSAFSGLRKHSGKIVKAEICWNTCELPLVSLNCLHWIQCICTRTRNNTFSVYHFILFIYFAIKSESTAIVIRGSKCLLSNIVIRGSKKRYSSVHGKRKLCNCYRFSRDKL